MTPELWERLKPLFEAALETPSGERKAFIAKVSAGDEELCRELEVLMKAHEESGSTVDAVAANIQAMVPTALPAFSPGEKILGRFRIVRRLGSGGMGDVYEAVDLELSQSIALKSIRPEIAGNREVLARFKKEVQLARRLSGLNVCRIHELFVVSENDSAAASAFLTMELLDGVTLAEEIHQAGPLPWNRAKEIAGDICAALATIHEAGIIHRDLKTRNIMLTQRNGSTRVVLMDFGLARELAPQSPTAETGLTVPGAVLGTPAYMAPEQFAGGEVSPATDIYAMGVVLYEMVTAKHPFSSSSALEAAILRARPPQPASSLRPGLPRHWDTVISKCLEYDPQLRYQSAGVLKKALLGTHFLGHTLLVSRKRALTTLAGFLILFLSLFTVPALRERLQGVLFASREKHIAVLPFDVTGDNSDTAALSDGLMDSLCGRLASLDTFNQSLWVVPSSEVRARKVTNASGAWREFGATMVLKGTLERHGDAIHLTLALIDSRKVRQIGSADLRDTTGNLASLEDEAILRISRLFNISGPRTPLPDPGRAASPAVFESYLTALGYMQRYDKPGNLDTAIAVLGRVVNQDPTFTLGFAQLGEAYRLKFQLDKNPQWLDEAVSSCKRASAAGGQTPALLITLAKIHETTGQNDLALQELQRALDLDPRNADAVRALAGAYEHAGRNADAESTYKKSINLRPEDWDGYQTLANFYDEHGRSQDAIRLYQHAIELTPDNVALYVNLGGAYIDSGDPKLLPEAERALKKSIEMNPQYQALSNLAYLYLIQGRYSEAAKASEKALDLDKNDYEAWSGLVTAYQWLGLDEKANAARAQVLVLAEQAARLNPKDAEAQSALAALYARQGQAEKARQRIKTALALGPDNSIVLSSVADAYELLVDRRHAIEYTRKALKMGLTTEELRVDPDLQAVIKDPRFSLPPAKSER